MRWHSYAAISLTVFAGCGTIATRPPTPARELDVRALKHPAPGERYFILVFGSQTTPKIPRLTHTWATVVRIQEAAPGCAPEFEHHTISWMPATLKLRPERLTVEPGVNLGVHETMVQVALANRERISLWGPYECRPRLVVRFLTQKYFLESGAVGYQSIDTLGEAGRKGNACDCIHAITDMDPYFGRTYYTAARFGDAASRHIARSLRQHNDLIHPEKTHDHVAKMLGLDAYPIVQRDMDEILPMIGSGR